MTDALTICNGCDSAPADPSSAAGYCARCEAEARSWDVRVTYASGTADHFHFTDQYAANEFRVRVALGPGDTATSGPCGSLAACTLTEAWRTDYA